MVTRLIAFDPGAHTAAWAAFEDGRLVRCGLERDSDGSLWLAFERRFRGVEARVVIELPQVYGRRDERDPNDLIMVAVTIGRIAQSFGIAGNEAKLIRPHDWKGNVPKEIMLKRIRERLDVAEHAVLDATVVIESLRHNVIDAIGLGLSTLGRLR